MQDILARCLQHARVKLEETHPLSGSPSLSRERIAIKFIALFCRDAKVSIKRRQRMSF